MNTHASDETGADAAPHSDTPESADRHRLLGLINASWTTQAIAAAVKLGLIDALSAGPCSAQDLARACHVHEPSLYRLLRALTSLDLCRHLDHERFALTPTGALLQGDAANSLAAWALLNGTRAWTQWGRLAESVRTGQSIRKLTLAHDDFSHLDEDAAAAALFNQAMVGLTAPVAAELARKVDFSGVRSVVDVGGGYGQLLCSVLAAWPAVHGVLFDMAHATGALAPHFIDAGVAMRCERVTGSFFDAVPGGADAYLLKSILHDWDDERCLLILRNCRRAMHSGARLLVVERIASVSVGANPHDQLVARADLNMMIANGGCERTESEYRRLLESAGLKLGQVTGLVSGFSVIDAVAV